MHNFSYWGCQKLHIQLGAVGGGGGVSQKMTIADEGGRVREKFDRIGFKVPKMCVTEIS